MTGDHSNWRHLLFYVGLALFACHEMDAVTRHEWRLLPGLSLLDDRTAQLVFVLAHVPLFAVLFWLTGHRSTPIRQPSQLGMDTLLVLHAVAHFAFVGHALNEFEYPLEHILIYGSAIVGALHAALTLLQAKAL